MKRDTTPRTCWQKCWVQICLEIGSRLPSAARRAANERLAAAGAEYA